MNNFLVCLGGYGGGDGGHGHDGYVNQIKLNCVITLCACDS